jgi:mono/diheme cytochrome c family protein
MSRMHIADRKNYAQAEPPRQRLSRASFQPEIQVKKVLALILTLFLNALLSEGGRLLGAEPLQLYAKTTSGQASPQHSQSPTYMRDVLPILMGKCGRCHSEQSFLQNWLDYTNASKKRWEIKRRVWDSWHGAYFKQPMPTGNSPESQAMTEEERVIVRDWVESGAQYGVAPPLGSGAESKEERIEAGKRLFATVCAACHQASGQGIPGRFPPLAGSDLLNSDKHRAIQIVVNGLQGEVVVNGQRFNNSMPKFPLSDQDIANALSYVYSSFGNSGKDVTSEEVKAVRGEKNNLPSVAQAQSPAHTEEKSPYE